jgi:hypothetical protein
MAKKTIKYIDNEAFYAEMVKYKTAYDAAMKKDLQKPRISEKIGYYLLEIAKGLARHKRFVNYSYKEEMISDGLENCVKYLHNYDVSRTNPFAYFTMIMYYAFVRRIENEKKEAHGRLKLLAHIILIDQPADIMEATFHVGTADDLEMYEVLEKIDAYEAKQKKKNEKRRNSGK